MLASFQNAHIRSFDLIQNPLLLFLVELPVILQNMFLTILGKLLLSLFQCHTHIPTSVLFSPTIPPRVTVNFLYYT